MQTVDCKGGLDVGTGPDVVGKLEANELFRTSKFFALQNWVPLVYSLTSDRRYVVRLGGRCVSTAPMRPSLAKSEYTRPSDVYRYGDDLLPSNKMIHRIPINKPVMNRVTSHRLHQPRGGGTVQEENPDRTICESVYCSPGSELSV